MTEQSDLFGAPPQPLRGRHYVRPRGYAGTPGRGPAGAACRTCRHLARVECAKTYLKCGLARERWTGGRASDVLAGSPACQFWEAPS
ncbi:hypothetical protein SAMN05421742_1282 [Roseospirillum parvum]|uniref:Uncharacterized protein n=1 Tax=Roseospirillum parvum TaxID=83401 RepID=A0A1G8GHW3_9PROT|nr:hypothetical protein SAMN05421742_1282 [Roseospirillum parvum]